MPCMSCYQGLPHTPHAWPHSAASACSEHCIPARCRLLHCHQPHLECMRRRHQPQDAPGEGNG